MARRVLYALLAAAFLAVPWAAPGHAQVRPEDLRATEIRVEGAQRIEAETVRTYITIKPGDPITSEAMDRSLKKLFGTGLFADVVVHQEGAVLVVRVVENPIINRIAFEGNKSLEEESLRPEIKLRPRVVYTRTRVRSDVQRIIDISLEGFEETRPGCAIHHPMITGHGAGHEGRDRQLAVFNDGSLLARTDRQNGALGRIDDRRKFPNAEHAQVGNTERAALIFFGH